MAGNEGSGIGREGGVGCGRGVNIGIVTMPWGGGNGGGGGTPCNCGNLKEAFEAFMAWYMGIGGLLKPPVDTVDDLEKKYPNPENGWTVLVLDEQAFYVWRSGGNGDPGEWTPVGSPGQFPVAGPQGPQGTEGPQGPQGEPGPQGIPGITGAVPDVGSLPAEGETLKPGTVMYVIDEGKFYVWIGSEWKQIEVAAMIPGPEGAQGAPGPVGPTGPQGPIGPAGPGGNGDVSALVQEVQSLRELLNELTPKVETNLEMIRKLAQLMAWKGESLGSGAPVETENLVDMHSVYDALMNVDLNMI